jgi:hypothetical protein
MTQAEKLIESLTKDINSTRSGTLGVDIASSIARLANVQVKCVLAELKYTRGATKKKISFFEEE